MADSAASPDVMAEMYREANRVLMGFYCIGLPISSILTGCALLQAIQYCTIQNQQTWRKLLAATSAGLCLLLSALELSLLFQTSQSTISSNPLVEPFFYDTGTAQGMILNGIALMSQAYFTSICYQLCGRRTLLLCAIGTMMILTVIGSLFWTIATHRLVVHGLKPILEIYSTLDLGFYWTGIAASMLLNIVLSVIMYRGLLNMRTSSEFGETRFAIDILSRCVFESYILTAVASVAVFATAIGMFRCAGLKALYMAAGNFCTSSILARIYSISFLYTLSRRALIVDRWLKNERRNKTRSTNSGSPQLGHPPRSKPKFGAGDGLRPAVHVLVSVEKRMTSDVGGVDDEVTSSHAHSSPRHVTPFTRVDSNDKTDIESQLTT